MHPIAVYALGEVLAQLRSIGPITLLMIVFYVCVKQDIIVHFWETIGGLLCASTGLSMFLFGIKGSIMPLGERIGVVMYDRFSTLAVMVVSFMLGVLVTVAEPAISSIRPMGRKISAERSPFLYYMVREQVEILVLCIGLGVGVATSLGACRFLYDWKLRSVVLIVTPCCFALTMLVYWLTDDLHDVLALAWDVGAITTGPVTVPIMLSLGVGAAAKRIADVGRAVEAEPPLDGFGLVTLASLIPVMSVLCLALVFWATVDKADIIARAIKSAHESDDTVETPPLREVIYGLRSLTPLSVFLIGFTHFGLRESLPVITMDSVIRGGTARPETSRSSGQPDMSSANSPAQPIAAVDSPVSYSGVCDYINRNAVFLAALASGQVGLILFNIGLHYGFSSLGSQVGELLPSMYTSVPSQPNSPFLPFAAGTIVSLLFTGAVGVLATVAEPGLNVLAGQVKRLTNGVLKRKHTVYSVGVGVSIGMMMGASNLQVGVNIIVYLIPMYVVALVLTMFSSEAVINVAWDAAGVTTGPVTVPFVIALGIAYAGVSGDTTGFGVLSCASVGPIISTLVVGVYKSRVRVNRRTGAYAAEVQMASGADVFDK